MALCWKQRSQGRGWESHHCGAVWSLSRPPTRWRPFPGPEGSWGLRLKRSLEAHLSQHSGQKPVQCPEYDRSFSQKNAIQAHQRLHSTRSHSPVGSVARALPGALGWLEPQQSPQQAQGVPLWPVQRDPSRSTSRSTQRKALLLCRVQPAPQPALPPRGGAPPGSGV